MDLGNFMSYVYMYFRKAQGHNSLKYDIAFSLKLNTMKDGENKIKD